MHVVYIYIYMNFIVIFILFLVLNNETEFYDDVHNPDYVFNTLQIKGWHISPEEQVKVYIGYLKSKFDCKNMQKLVL